MRENSILYTYNQTLDKAQFEIRIPKTYNAEYQSEVKHEIARYGNFEETLSCDYGHSDWTPDIYNILTKTPVLTA